VAMTDAPAYRLTARPPGRRRQTSRKPTPSVSQCASIVAPRSRRRR
jgi:hypothetical protein